MDPCIIYFLYRGRSIDLRDFAKKSDENSENHKKDWIKKFCLLWFSLIFISFMIFLFTKNLWALILWVGIYAIFRRQLLFNDKLKEIWEIINSNKFVKIIDIVANMIIFILLISYIISEYGHLW